MVADCEQGFEFGQGERTAVTFDGLENGDLSRRVIGDEAVAPSGLEKSANNLQLVVDGAGGGLGRRGIAPSGEVGLGDVRNWLVCLFAEGFDQVGDNALVGGKSHGGGLPFLSLQKLPGVIGEGDGDQGSAVDGLVNVRKYALDLVGGGSALGSLGHAGEKLLGYLAVSRLGGTVNTAAIGKRKSGPEKRASDALVK